MRCWKHLHTYYQNNWLVTTADGFRMQSHSLWNFWSQDINNPGRLSHARSQYSNRPIISCANFHSLLHDVITIHQCYRQTDRRHAFSNLIQNARALLQMPHICGAGSYASLMSAYYLLTEYLMQRLFTITPASQSVKTNRVIITVFFICIYVILIS